MAQFRDLVPIRTPVFHQFRLGLLVYIQMLGHELTPDRLPRV
jgi:hypothetical protein